MYKEARSDPPPRPPELSCDRQSRLARRRRRRSCGVKSNNTSSRRGKVEAKSKRYTHSVTVAKRLAAVGTFPESRGHPVFDTLVAEDMPAGLDGGVFEVFVAYGADGDHLWRISTTAYLGHNLLDTLTRSISYSPL